MRLFHFSEEPGIARFTPRPSSYLTHHAVWAIEERMAWAYLTPRDCPRIYYYGTPESSQADLDTFLCGQRGGRALAIEAAWSERCWSTALTRYEFALERFVLRDANAGYYISEHEELPIGRETIASPLIALLAEGVELRILPELWELREAIYRSSLGWGFIRMRNAAPPRDPGRAYLPV